MNNTKFFERGGEVERLLDTGAYSTFEVFPRCILDVGALKMLGTYSNFYGTFILINYIPDYEVINFGIRLSFLIKAFFYMSKKSGTKRAFKVK